MYQKEAWQVNEAHLETYRSNFYTTQMLLIVTGALLLDKSRAAFIVVSLVALFQMWYIWFRVIAGRIYIADFHKFSIYKHYDENGDLCGTQDRTFRCLRDDAYASKRIIRQKVNDSISNSGKITNYHGYPGRFHNYRLTRKKLDVCIPVSFTIIWICFWVVVQTAP